jgi:hypothetical protein
MMKELSILFASAASIGFIHTPPGPDHQPPFVAMAKASAWPRKKTLRVTVLCGVGHVPGSVVLGFLEIGLGGAI